ncbi:hypothetical protein V495_07087 [Pseudogymnoascus sp. VKM F-4514 (FW-929)]|nr:hypothetical protein V495_07087 [Pseudogymnoascus sp. VKM F-4514 (FW-929)]KFY54173.1 hypothetical protein V497_07912 [Pseudogymnoascus sp. VKM F-4516 (FW-969)]
MARPSITADSDLVEDQIQREAESHGHSNPSPEKKKHRRSLGSRRSEERHRRTTQDNIKSKDADLDHDDTMATVLHKDPLGSSLSKKRKRNRHRDQSKLYEVPGVENLPAKRKSSYRVSQDPATEAPAKTWRLDNGTSYPGSSPFMSPPKALVPQSSVTNASLESPLAKQARLDTILKSCSRKTIVNAELDEDETLNKESDGSPSPSHGRQPPVVKTEHEAPKLSFRDMLKACDGKNGRFSCPIEGCEKSYTRKDSLAGHMPKCHEGQMFHDNGDNTYSVITQLKKTTAMDRNLKSVHREINKYTNWGGNSHEDTRDELASKTNEKEAITVTKRKPTTRNAMAERSVPVKSLPQPESPAPGHQAGTERDSSASPVVVRPPILPQPAKPVNAAVGNITSVEAPYGSAMEDWEVFPGIFRAAENNVNSGGHAVAYSAHHIRNNPAVAEFANTSFAIHTVLGGRSFGFPIETFARVCYVVSGKLQVHVDGADFAIGKGGMWRVTRLGSCVAGNRSYEDAVIHITSVRAERGGLV